MLFYNERLKLAASLAVTVCETNRGPPATVGKPWRITELPQKFDWSKPHETSSNVNECPISWRNVWKNRTSL